MFSFLQGIENGKWKWQCVHCKEIFYTEVGRTQDTEKHECKKAAETTIAADGKERRR